MGRKDKKQEKKKEKGSKRRSPASSPSPSPSGRPGKKRRAEGAKVSMTRKEEPTEEEGVALMRPLCVHGRERPW